MNGRPILTGGPLGHLAASAGRPKQDAYRLLVDFWFRNSDRSLHQSDSLRDHRTVRHERELYEAP